MNRLRRLGLATAAGTYLLIVVGAVVRTTGSGLGCPDWPLCHGQLLPPPDSAAIIEWTHRLLGAVVSPAIIAVSVATLIWGRSRKGLLLPALLIPILLTIQILLGRVVVELELPTMVVLVHLGFALVILGLIVWIAASATRPEAAFLSQTAAADMIGLRTLAAVTTVATFVLLMSGAYVRAIGAGWVCLGFPLCGGWGLPFGTNRLVDLHLTHRVLAYLVGVLVLAIAWRAWRLRGVLPSIAWLGLAMVVLLVTQIAIGAVMVTLGPGAAIQSAHVAGAAAFWAATVAMLAMAYRPSRGSGAEAARVERSVKPANLKRTFAAYVALTKPRVMVLLLLTTLAAMLMVQRGSPPLELIFFTLLGGALAAGGAGAINHYLDRDVDELMGRTAARPIPAGLIPPRHALVFGVTLGALSFLLMVAFVNLLSASLTLLALLFYVFIYTMWLKRATPANIVIGGAAGAIPPVVGIAAVTNEVSALALFLFTLVFIWTPPHFWALSLLMRREYEAAGIPMLPIVRGDDETRRQILLYSLAMVGLTLLVFGIGMLGAVYLVAAIGLGSLFLVYSLRLLRDQSARSARRLFRYSMVYLALMFVAMVVDRQVVL